MRVFIDARMLHSGGTLTVATGLVDAMLTRYGNEHEFTVLLARGQEMPDCTNARILLTKTCNPLWWLLSDFFYLPRLVRAHKAEIYHTLKRPHIGNLCGIRKVITLHAIYAHFYPEFQSVAERLFLTPQMKNMARRADAVIAVSGTERANIAEALSIPKDKIFRVYNAADAVFFKKPDGDRLEAVRARYGLVDPFVLYAGRAYRYKNLPNMLRAFDRFCSESSLPHRFVWIGGSGAATKEVKNTIEQMQNKNRVVRLSDLPREEVPIMFRLADMFMFPTIYDAFGIPVIEAMASGTPVIISNMGALPEVASEAAVQVNPYDIDAMASAIHKVLSDRQLRDRLIEAGHRRARCFSWDNSARALMDVYRRLLSGDPLRGKAS